MKIANIIIGEKFRYSEEFVSYLQKKIINAVSKIDATVILKDNDPSIIQELQNFIEKYDIVIIATSKQSWPLVAKSLATRLNDTLTPKDDMLIPSKCTDYTRDSFYVKILNKSVNVLKIDEDNDIPEILTSFSQTKCTINVLMSDPESVRLMINPIATTNDISITYTKHIGGYIRCETIEGKYGNIPSFLHNVQNLLPAKVAIGSDLGVFLINELSKYNMTLSIAESCTGGLLSYQLTKIPGSSRVFVGSMITYANEIKTAWLGVGETDLTRNGAVSEEVVSMMLDGIMNASNSHFSIAVSGIAGPDGGSGDKPVGTVFVGVKHTNGTKNIQKLTLKGDRSLIQQGAAHTALRMLSELFLQNF